MASSLHQCPMLSGFCGPRWSSVSCQRLVLLDLPFRQLAGIDLPKNTYLLMQPNAQHQPKVTCTELLVNQELEPDRVQQMYHQCRAVHLRLIQMRKLYQNLINKNVMIKVWSTLPIHQKGKLNLTQFIILEVNHKTNLWQLTCEICRKQCIHSSHVSKLNENINSSIIMLCLTWSDG